MATSTDFGLSETDDTYNLQKTSLSLSEFNEIIKQPPSEVLCFILENKTNFISLLKEKDTEQDLICFAVITLGLACTDETYPRRNLNELMLFLSSVMDSIPLNLQRWLISLHKQKNLEKLHFHALFHFTMFLKVFQLTLPSSSFDFVSILLPLLIQTSEKCLRDDAELYKTVSEMLNEINAEKNRFFEHYTTFDIKRESEKEKLQLQEPPESYRSLSILPTVDDIESPCSFLRPSIAKGKYKDTEHYLDVQFRLLREDFIRPLRDGIAEYLSIKKKMQSLRNCKNVRAYSNVCIDSEIFVDGDLLHVLQFSDAYFTEINWENSKRLMYGNLLCLSMNDFRSMLFATVVKRDPKDLKQGLLTVKFEGINEAIINLKLSDSFVVIETTALFESYRHNLNVLQLLSEESLSMKRYIVDVEKTVNKPQYLQSTTQYDMTPLLLPFNDEFISMDELIDRNYYKYETVTVLQDCSWPSASDLNLDESQHLALKLAITKEFSIIQGPPGTGKTYVGLRAVQLLLHNIDSWFTDNSNAFPILIVCYTNHALDQFLVGISKLTEKIARIGGKLSNEKMEQYRIQNLVKRYRVPEICWEKMSDAKDKSCELKEKINEINSYIENSTKSLLNEHILKDHIPSIQYSSICSFTKSATGLSQNVKVSKSINIYNWLQIGTSEESFAAKKSDSTDPSIRRAVLTNEETDFEGEADIEFTVNQRNIDFYNFDEAHVLRKKMLPEERTAGSSEQEWQFQNKNKKKFAAYIRENLRKNRAMPAHLVKRIRNVWTLDINERWQLYKFWLECFIEEKRKQHADLQKELSVAMKKLADARVERDLAVLENIHVVGMTTTGAAKYRHILDARNPVILIVEEAAEILESHIITSLTPKTQHVILIGDQQQLRPSPTVYMLAVKYGMNISLFERMIKNGMEYCRLSVQHRMRPEIASLIVPHIYPNLKNHETVTKFENIRGVSKNVFFVNHNFEELVVQDSKSKVNEHEARFLLKLCNYLLLQGYEPSQITILTTYSGQLFAIKNLATDEVKEVRCTVVDNFQGEENDIILISFVRSNNDGEVGFLKVSNRICVALSRAKIGLYCIGNFELFSQKSKLWKNVTQTLSEAGSIGQVLYLACQNHPDIINEVKTDKDFDSCPEGGCNRKCDYRLRCGHSCVLFCHPYDMKHENIKCEKTCIESCVNEHPCNKKCFENCDPCETLMDRVLSKCKHTVNAPCGMKENKIKCNNPCNKICKNDHPCPKRCFECSGFCEVLMDRLLSRCGHTVNTKCGELEENIKCENPCKKTCDKGHPCSRKCYQCLSFRSYGFSIRRGFFHQSNHNDICEVLIDRKLSRCGHTVNAPCGKSVYEIECGNPCSKSCERGHPCTKKCFEPCVCEILVDKTCDVCGSSDKFPCKEISSAKCQWPCIKKCSRDHSCQKKCFEICYCENLIEKTLKCRHKVMAECGKSEPLITCMSQCEKILSCQHRCKKKCYERCTTACSEIIDIQSPICKHNVKIQCRLKSYDNRTYLIRSCTELCDQILPCGHACKSFCRRCRTIGSHSECTEVCKKKLPCGHECSKICNESCEVKCMQITDTYLPGCGHSIKIKCFMRNSLEELTKRCTALCKELLPCGHTCEGTCGTCKQGKEHIKCRKMCNKKLNCLHECTNICSEPCISECMQLVEVQSSVCQHYVEIECSFSLKFDKLSLKCSESCVEILPCGHTCKGSCGSCYQGRLHIACKETCEKILICGHKCESKCFKSCPPCAKPCENKCFHGKCRKKCGDPCGKCNKPCTWRCRHKKCNHRCNEICDREPCNEPCLKVMTCNHPCVGYCGEPCPEKCLICDIESNQCSNDVPKNDSVGYIYLEDCNHLVREKELSEWLTSGPIEQLKIQLKKCPRCGTFIRNNFRFNKIIKKCLAEVEIVKQLTKWNRYHNLKIQSNLLGMAKAASGNKSVFFKPVIDVFSSNYIRDIHELTNIESVISIAIEIECKTYSAFAPNTDLETLIDYILSCRKRLSVFILDNIISISEFQLLQLIREVHRINLLDFMLKFANKMQLGIKSHEFETCLKCLMTSKSFTDGSIKDFEATFKNFSDRFPNESGDVPKNNFILKVMNLSGYWYFCPKKHVNCIAGNIEAAQEICFECDKNIVKNQMMQKVSQGDANIDVKESHEFKNQQCLNKMPESSKSNMNDLKNSSRYLKESYLHEIYPDSSDDKSIANHTRTTENIKFTDKFHTNWRRDDRSNLLTHHMPPQKSFSKKSGRQNHDTLEWRKNGAFEGRRQDTFLRNFNPKERIRENFESGVNKQYKQRDTSENRNETRNFFKNKNQAFHGNNKSVITASANENTSDFGQISFAKPEITRSSQQQFSSSDIPDQVNKDTRFETNFQRSNEQNTKIRQPEFFSKRRENAGRGRGNNKSTSSVNENASDCGRSSFVKRDTIRSSQHLSTSEHVNKDTRFETNSRRSNGENDKQSQPGFFNERRANTGRGRGRGRGYHQRHQFH